MAIFKVLNFKGKMFAIRYIFEGKLRQLSGPKQVKSS